MKAINYEQARMVEYALLVILTASGLLHPIPSLYYKCFGACLVILYGGSLATAVLFQAFAKMVGKLIQTSANAQPTHYMDEIKDTFLGFGVVVASIAAWPVAQSQMGIPTAMRSSLNECVPFGDTPLAPLMYMIKAVAGLLIADAYNYWKHRFFHGKVLWAFHKVHHSHHNPSAMAGYAVSPVFGFATFFPIYLFCFPALGLYLPLHWPILVFYGFLNHYLHCGYTIECVERVLSPLCIMTSRWHNVHHEKGRMGFNYRDQTFGEMLSLWDILMGTYPQGHYLFAGSAAKRAEQEDNTPKKVK